MNEATLLSKNFISYLHRSFIRKFKPKGRVLIASIPRCGSTFLIRALGHFKPGPVCPETLDCGFVRNLNKIPRKKFLKTHSIAPKSLPKDIKVIFLYCDPVNAILSTYNKRFDKKHFINCGYYLDKEPDILNKDELGYENIFDSWVYKKKDYSVLALRYEKIFDNISYLESYLNYNINLGMIKKRTTVVDSTDYHKLNLIYKSLINKINEMSDVEIITPDI